VSPPGAVRLLDVQGLRKHFPIRKGFLRRQVGVVRAVDDVSFHVEKGETLSLVGESGCGKTTTSRCILRALTPTEGRILFHAASGQVLDVAALSKRELQPLRRQMQMIFQDPFSSLNPRRTLLDIVAEPLVANGVGNREERLARVVELLRLVGLRPEYMRRYPHAFSVGQRQRVGIARALAVAPKLIIADEPVSALDLSIQAQIINLLQDLQREFQLTYLFIAHDLAVVRHLSNRVAVMYLGKVVEVADRNDIYAHPQHPYTKALLSSIPVPDPIKERERDLVVLKGEIPSPVNPPSGCRFHPRCPIARAPGICSEQEPALEPHGQRDQIAACHFAGQF